MTLEKSLHSASPFHSNDMEGSDSAEKTDLHVPLDAVRMEWKTLWHNRIDDKVRAEGIANRNYQLLFVESGTVIVATRDFKPLDLKEILRSHGVQDVDRLVSPHPSVGGWGKFIRTELNKQKRFRERREKPPTPRRNRKANLQQKKGGRGWLHHQMNK